MAGVELVDTSVRDIRRFRFVELAVVGGEAGSRISIFPVFSVYVNTKMGKGV
jgi:hypothetical protein